jgi:hypothetical protein
MKNTYKNKRNRNLKKNTLRNKSKIRRPHKRAQKRTQKRKTKQTKKRVWFGGVKHPTLNTPKAVRAQYKDYANALLQQLMPNKPVKSVARAFTPYTLEQIQQMQPTELERIYNTWRLSSSERRKALRKEHALRLNSSLSNASSNVSVTPTQVRRPKSHARSRSRTMLPPPPVIINNYDDNLPWPPRNIENVEQHDWEGDKEHIDVDDEATSHLLEDNYFENNNHEDISDLAGEINDLPDDNMSAYGTEDMTDYTDDEMANMDWDDENEAA